MPKKMIGLLGGTFDPVHFGHLRAALEVQQILHLSQVHFLPCQMPVHKNTTQTLAKHRLAMLTLATQSEPTFIVDTREVYRDTPSYMIETLQSLREEFKEASLLLLLGSDVFPELPTWHQWEHILDYAHIIIMLRPNKRLVLETALKQYLEQHTVHDAGILETETHGGIYVQAITALDISSTMIRYQLDAGLNPRYLLPDAVLAYIKEQNLY